MRFKTAKSAKQSVFQKELPISEYIPYKCHWNSDTILTKNNGLLRVVKLKGFAFETADDVDIDLKKDARNNLLKGMASGNFSMWFHTIRRKEAAFPDGEYDEPFSQRVNDEWEVRHSGKKSFVNEHYLCILYQSDKSGVAMLENIIKTIKYRADATSWQNDMKESFGELEEVTERVLNGMSAYGAQLLGLTENDNGVFSELLEFLAMLVNGGYHQPMALPLMPIDKYLCNSRIYFGPKSMEIRNNKEVRYAGIVSLKEYRPSTNAGILDGFLQLPFEFIITQSFSFVNRMVAISGMQLQQRRLIQSEDVAVSQVQEIDEALDAAMSGAYAFGMHHLSITCVEDSVKSLESALSMCVVELSNVGITGVREKLSMEPCYWAQLPGNGDFITRKSTVNTLNVAGFASFHNYPSGKRVNNHWGDAVTVFNTVSGTPFFFNFHVRDVGHTMIIGPTGAGKTVLMNFLCAQAQKYRCRMFFFDKDRGAEIFIRAIGGKYSSLSVSEDSGFNPLALDDTYENRAFLIELIRAMMSSNGEPITSEDMTRINSAVSGIYKLPAKERTLSSMSPFLGLMGPGSLAERFAMWHGKGSHAKIFDNPADTIDFSSARSFGFEMAEILQDKASIGPVLLYLFHRINSSLDGTPTMIILDEAWALIDNPIFAPKIKDWLKVLRKLNAFVVFATQSVEDASKSDISDTLVQQTATQIYLPNLKATSAYTQVFALSEREFTLVKNTDPGSRFFLVKQDNNGVIARINLSNMDDVINVLSARADTVILLKELMSEVGEDPDKWLDIFYERAANI